jgi:hypothetical protein
MVSTILHTLPKLIGLAVLILGFYGFWRGLTLPPHKEGHRAPPPRFFWGGWF